MQRAARQRAEREVSISNGSAVCKGRKSPAFLLYYGSWGDDTEELTATHFTNNGPERVKATIDKLP